MFINLNLIVLIHGRADARKSALKFGELMLKSRARRHFFSSSHLKWVNVMKISLQFASAIFCQTVILNQMLALQKL